MTTCRSSSIQRENSIVFSGAAEAGLPKFNWKTAAAVAAFIGIQYASELIITASFILLAVWALFGGIRTIQALSLGLLLVLLNPAIFPTNSSLLSFRWVVVFFAVFRVYLERITVRGGFPRWVLHILFFSVFVRSSG